MTESSGLQRNALSTAESVVMGVAGTAPAFSIAATTATLFAVVGERAPASLLYCGLIMLGVALAFRQLNRINPSAGATYAWVGQVFHPTLGFFAGWALLVASALFMVSGTIPAATATLMLVSPEHADQPGWVSLVAAGWLLAVSAVVVKGIKPTSYTQVLMTGIEVGVLLLIVIAALIRLATSTTASWHWAWVLPTGFSWTDAARGALVGLFFFWGWDVTVNLNEETRDGGRAAGLSALLSMVLVLLLFVSFAIATAVVLTEAEIQTSSTNLVFAVAEHLFPGPWAYAAIVAVMLSTVGTLETSILQFTRTLFAKGRDGVLHPRYAVLHRSWRTPWVATAAITLFGLLLLFLGSLFPSVSLLIRDSVNAISFQVAFYYSLACFACAWHFRRKTLHWSQGSLALVLWPLLSATALVGVMIASLPSFDGITLLIGCGGIAIGVVPWWLNRRRHRRPRA